MLKKVILSTVFILLAINSVIFAHEEQKQESLLNVDASIQKEYAPDTATIRFYVENQGLNVADLKEKNDVIVNNAITKIKEKLTPDEQIKTIALSVNTFYNYKDKIRVFQKYEVRNGFEVKLKDIDKVSQIINIAINNGVKKVDNLSFTLENTQGACDELLSKVVIEAKNRAKIIAQSADSQILKVKNINPYCSAISNTPRPRYYTNKAMMADSAGAETSAYDTIEAGLINLKANVNMVYYLK